MNIQNIERLRNLRDELASLDFPTFPEDTWPVLNNWKSKAIPIIRADWPQLYDDFTQIAAKPIPRLASVRSAGNERANLQRERFEWERRSKGIEEVRHNILGFLEGIMALSLSTEKPTDISALDKVIFICKRFTLFARQLSTRERKRQPVIVEDEYDVQYLLYALLRLLFDDVRQEEWTPSYAGGSSRMDFLLKAEKIVIEAKKTNDNLRDRLVCDQLIIDIERYTVHQDCKTLVCFVFDPDRLLENPIGLEKDLSRVREKIETIVVISR